MTKIKRNSWSRSTRVQIVRNGGKQGKKEAKGKGRLQARLPSPTTTASLPLFQALRIEIPIKILDEENLLKLNNNNKKIQ